MRLGKQPPRYDARTLQLAAYLEGGTIAKTDDVGEVNRLPANWQVLGNDQYGDCVFAGAAHETVRWNHLRGQTVAFDDHHVLADYSAVTGFNPNNPGSDQGTVVLDALKYRAHTGVADATGTRHKLAAYVQLEPGHPDHVRAAVHYFDAVGIGIQFPQSAMDQFNSQVHPIWSVVAGAKIEGGHYIPVVAYSPRFLYVVTWGRLIRMTWGFFARYCDEAWALFSEEALTAGHSPEGLDIAALLADLKAVKN